MKRNLFSEPWWLEAIAPGRWGEVSVEENGRRVAEMRYVSRTGRFGLVRLGSDSLAPRIGPSFDLPQTKSPTMIGRSNELAERLVSQLPRYDYLSFELSSAAPWLPFFWTGFRQMTRYSYVLRDLGDLDAVWAGMSQGTRNAIRKGELTLSVVRDRGQAIHDLVVATFRRQRMRNPYPRATLDRAIHASQREGKGAVLTAVDAQERPTAAAFFVWDDDRMYYLVGASDPHASGGAMSVILWHAIQLAASQRLMFDFEGSMIPTVEKFFRGFGGRLEPYSHITDTSRRLAVALAVRDIGLAVRRRRR